MAGLVSSIKNDVKKAGANKGKFIYFRPDQKQRIRFLQDMDDGIEVVFHDSFERGINVPCQEAMFGRSCPYCDDEGVRTRSQYAWCVYNYDAKEVQIFMFAVNNCTPIPSLMAMYETYGTLVDRDYVISVSGKGPDKSYSVVPMDKVKFRNEKAKPFSTKKMLEMLDKAYPCTDDDDDEDDEPKRRKPTAPKVKGKAKPEPEDDDEDDWGEELPDNDELMEMSAKELYNMCKERDIEAKPKKSVEYYVDLLEEWRENNMEQDEDKEEEEEEEDDAPDYSEMSAKELYQLCKERKMDVMAKKPAKYYIKQLEDYDKAHDDWDEEDDYDDEQDWEEEDE